MAHPEETWVTVRRYDDGLAAQIAVDFLRDHGIPVALRGNSGATAILNRFDTVLDVRLVVRARHRLDALEALSALEEPGTPLEARDELAPCSGHPYRDLTTHEGAPMPRYRRAAFALALMLPMGAGHFYAGEMITGALFASAIATSTLLALLFRDQGLWLAGMLMVVCDALMALSAVRRHNDGEPAAKTQQALRAGAAIAGALVLGAALR